MGLQGLVGASGLRITNTKNKSWSHTRRLRDRRVLDLLEVFDSDRLVGVRRMNSSIHPHGFSICTLEKSRLRNQNSSNGLSKPKWEEPSLLEETTSTTSERSRDSRRDTPVFNPTVHRVWLCRGLLIDTRAPIPSPSPILASMPKFYLCEKIFLKIIDLEMKVDLKLPVYVSSFNYFVEIIVCVATVSIHGCNNNINKYLWIIDKMSGRRLRNLFVPNQSKVFRWHYTENRIPKTLAKEAIMNK